MDKPTRSQSGHVSNTNASRLPVHGHDAITVLFLTLLRLPTMPPTLKLSSRGSAASAMAAALSVVSIDSRSTVRP